MNHPVLNVTRFWNFKLDIYLVCVAYTGYYMNVYYNLKLLNTLSNFI